MKKLSALALVASLSLAAPAFAQSPAQLRDNPFMNHVETPMETAKQAVQPDSIKESSANHHPSKHMMKKKAKHSHHHAKKSSSMKSDVKHETTTTTKKTETKKEVK